MTIKDKSLIEQAKKLTSSEWGKAFELSEHSDTEHARDVLMSIGKSLYHTEEAFAGII